jgi:hypothetical protein
MLGRQDLAGMLKRADVVEHSGTERAPVLAPVTEYTIYIPQHIYRYIYIYIYIYIPALASVSEYRIYIPQPIYIYIHIHACIYTCILT